MVEVKSAAAVAVVLTPESSEGQHLKMDDNGAGLVAERGPAGPAITEIAVFGGGEWKCFIEAAQRLQLPARKGNVVRAIKWRARVIGIVQKGNQQLTGVAANAVLRSGFDGAALGGFAQTKITGDGGTAPRLGEEADGKGGVASDHRFHRRPAIVDYQHFELVQWKREFRKGLEAAVERSRSIARGDDDGEEHPAISLLNGGRRYNSVRHAKCIVDSLGDAFARG